MTSDSIERILDDAAMPPEAYCRKHGCGQGVYDELADCVPDMCIHLIGRTEAVVRRSISELEDGGFSVGDKVMRTNGRIGEVIGFAIGRDGEKCLVLSMSDGHWKTYLCPAKDARLLKVPSPAEVRRLLEQAIGDAADHRGDYRNTDEIADCILDMARACFTGEELPVGRPVRRRAGAIGERRWEETGDED